MYFERLIHLPWKLKLSNSRAIICSELQKNSSFFKHLESNVLLVTNYNINNFSEKRQYIKYIHNVDSLRIHTVLFTHLYINFAIHGTECLFSMVCPLLIKSVYRLRRNWERHPIDPILSIILVLLVHLVSASLQYHASVKRTIYDNSLSALLCID